MPTQEQVIRAFRVDILDIEGEEQWSPPKKLRFTEEQRMIYRRLVDAWKEALGVAREEHDKLQTLFIFPDPSEHEQRLNQVLSSYSSNLQDLGRLGIALRCFLEGDYGPAIEHFSQVADEHYDTMHPNHDNGLMARCEQYITLMTEWQSA